MGHYWIRHHKKALTAFPIEASMTLERQSLSLVPMDQEAYSHRVHRSLAFAQDLEPPSSTLTPEEILTFFQDLETRLSNALMLIPSNPATPELREKRRELMLDWAFIHNETEKLYLEHPWLCPVPVMVLRRLTPTEKTALESLKRRSQGGSTDLVGFLEEFRPFTKFLDQSQPHNARELLGRLEGQVGRLEALLTDFHRQVTNWPD
ncbi:MAG: hypothetical protein LBS60_08415 [Deltaproteobacteria bacterium]|jgi:hypothetical protein|nr:hypothetical protein [Deltaproteobacteria bacterium]